MSNTITNGRMQLQIKREISGLLKNMIISYEKPIFEETICHLTPHYVFKRVQEGYIPHLFSLHAPGRIFSEAGTSSKMMHFVIMLQCMTCQLLLISVSLCDSLYFITALIQIYMKIQQFEN